MQVKGTNMVNVSDWYDLKPAYTDPLNKIVESIIFYKKRSNRERRNGKISIIK